MYLVTLIQFLFFVSARFYIKFHIIKYVIHILLNMLMFNASLILNKNIFKLVLKK